MIEKWEVRVYKSICDNCGKAEYRQKNRTLWQAKVVDRFDGSTFNTFLWNVEKYYIKEYGKFAEEGELIYPQGWYPVVRRKEYWESLTALYCSEKCMMKGEAGRKKNEQ